MPTRTVLSHSSNKIRPTVAMEALLPLPPPPTALALPRHWRCRQPTANSSGGAVEKAAPRQVRGSLRDLSDRSSNKQANCDAPNDCQHFGAPNANGRRKGATKGRRNRRRKRSGREKSPRPPPPLAKPTPAAERAEETEAAGGPTYATPRPSPSLPCSSSSHRLCLIPASHYTRWR